ncbi:hypothetical protein [Parasporobacterium paucivorans]|uniref:Chalcone isomerase N-terminal domain-containing protein n=1 Tax=Parasporobacterium paucivorans DSM 15970 TaxID=1122934 RepID=A0A1M6J324_9FIRM|nr:hypothetical protein [Parasporobacterium paucivorans]SHJ40941.1 hypothetical protein SAMN02745691_01909 [Parasporobacterium paucivorans DSM 15970]
MTMEKMVIFHNLLNENHRPAMERWFRRSHVPDVLTQYPWTSRYLLYRPVPAPEGAVNEGLYTYRIHENWASDIKNRRGHKGLMGMTPEPVSGAIKADIIHIPAEPTEDFLGGSWPFEKHSVLRWVIAYRYPENADKEECDRFFLEVQAEEIKKMTGLIRFFSHKAIEFEGSALPITTDDNKTDGSDKLKNLMRHWDRLSELWFECNDDWTNALIHNPPSFTKPEWATSDSFPFLKPSDDFISTFILESPDNDFTKTFSPLYY